MPIRPGDDKRVWPVSSLLSQVSNLLLQKYKDEIGSDVKINGNNPFSLSSTHSTPILADFSLTEPCNSPMVVRALSFGQAAAAQMRC